MSAVENSKLAIEEHQKIHVLEKTQKTETEAKSKKAAMLSSLDSLANMLIEERASDQVAKDEQEMNKRRLGSSNGTPGAANDTKGSKKSGKAGKKGKSSPPSSKKDGPTPTPTPPEPKPVKHESMFDQLMAHDDPLVALVMAGIEIQEKTNGMLSGLAKTGEMISKASTDAAKAGNDWMKNFYNHGSISGAPGTTAAEKDKYIFLVINFDGSYSYYTSPTGPTGLSGSVAYSQWVEGIMDKQGRGKTAPPGGLSDNEYKLLLANTVKRHYNNPITPGAWEGNSVTYSPVGGIPGASGSANSTEFSQLMSIWQFVQSQVSQTNNQFQTVAGLPSTMMQALMQAISTGRGAESSTNQAIGTAASLVNGWAGV